MLPSISLPCTDLDIYPKALSVISWKYTKAKITFIKGEMPDSLVMLLVPPTAS